MANVDAGLPEERTSILHIARSTIAALASQLIARGLHMPEPYWATVTTIVVMQSSLGAAWKVSRKRLAGTLLGAMVGGLLASYFGGNLIAFTVAMAGTGLVCLVLRLDRTAYRFAGITLTIIMLVARPQSAWIIAAHRFVEVSLGIAVALALTAVWRERQSIPAMQAPTT
ncbi:MAG: FUSC family protein [Terriglobales bacterium]